MRDGALPPGLDASPHRGRAAARSRAWRSLDQCRDGAGEARAAWRRARSPSCLAARLQAAARRHRRPRSPGRASSICGSRDRFWQARLAEILRAGRAYGDCDDRRGPARSTSSMSRPIRPGRCMSGMAAARWSAMRSPSLLEKAGFEVTPRVLHQRCRRAGRCARALGSICAIAKRSARRSARSPKASIPAII